MPQAGFREPENERLTLELQSMEKIQGIQGRAGSCPDGQMSWPKLKGSSLRIHCTEADYM